jgi:hypothetical protein
VRVVSDGRSAIDGVRRQHPDLLVLDVMTPGVDRLDVGRVLRREYDLPVLTVTAKAEAEDKLLGFDLGADDYLTKPYDRACGRCCGVPGAPVALGGSGTSWWIRCATRCGSISDRSHAHRRRSASSPP